MNLEQALAQPEALGSEWMREQTVRYGAKGKRLAAIAADGGRLSSL